MDCPNCYAKGLAPRALRCPRCDWLLLEPAPAGSSATFATPPVSNPWSVSATPELPTFPSELAPDHQMSALWGSAEPGLPQAAGDVAGRVDTPAERVVALSQARSGAPGLPAAVGFGPEGRGLAAPGWPAAGQVQASAPGLGSAAPAPDLARGSLSIGQRLTLILRALGALGPLLLLSIIALPRLPVLSSVLRRLDAPGWLTALVGVALVGLVLLRLANNVPLLLDGLSGELRQEVDLVASRTLTTVRFERLGRVRLADQRVLSGVRQGVRYRVSYSPMSKTVWALTRGEGTGDRA
jgi:hypothetical protein